MLSFNGSKSLTSDKVPREPVMMVGCCRIPWISVIWVLIRSGRIIWVGTLAKEEESGFD